MFQCLSEKNEQQISNNISQLLLYVQGAVNFV